MTDARYVSGVALFQQRRWFEAHEVLEAAWRATPPGPDREFLQGLIQLAVSLEHWRRGNPRGARGQWQKANRHLEGLPERCHGLELARLIADFALFYADVDLEARVEEQARGPLAGCSGASGPAAGWPTPRWCMDPIATATTP